MVWLSVGLTVIQKITNLPPKVFEEVRPTEMLGTRSHLFKIIGMFVIFGMCVFGDFLASGWADLFENLWIFEFLGLLEFCDGRGQLGMLERCDRRVERQKRAELRSQGGPAPGPSDIRCKIPQGSLTTGPPDVRCKM